MTDNGRSNGDFFFHNKNTRRKNAEETRNEFSPFVGSTVASLHLQSNLESQSAVVDAYVASLYVLFNDINFVCQYIFLADFKSEASNVQKSYGNEIVASPRLMVLFPQIYCSQYVSFYSRLALPFPRNSFALSHVNASSSHRRPFLSSK